MKIFAVLVIALAVFSAACEDPAANKPKATTSEPTNAASSNTAANSTATAANPATKGEALALNPENSSVEFTGSKVTGKHDGGFEKFTGTIDLVNAKPEESSVKVDIDMASVVSDNADLTDHLKTGDFFEVEKFPKSTFASTKIVADSAKGANAYTVTGDLEMRGVKKSITFPATITVSDADVAVKAEFAINRRDFGINYAGMANDLIRDDVVMRLDLKSPRKK